ncbi:MAG: class I SAM-dependent DNA methyltransferase [Candidatus Contendobacter sp.]|nr:MAG: class I SAM-dependent DNA methyltransferase [Candidatus Contendobacter sp.]
MATTRSNPLSHQPAPAQLDTFIATWRDSALTERAAAQSHFNQLCDLLGVTPPTIADPQGEWFCFEKGVKKTGGGDGWADVWRKDCFAWEYKGKHKDLGAALRQLQQYAPALNNPPLLIVCNLSTIEIHTNFTNTVVQVYRLTLDGLRDPEQRQRLGWAFTDPDRLKPDRTREAVTEDAATLLGSLAQRLRQRGHDPQVVAHALTRLLFCLFAEDIGLLPGQLFSNLLAEARQSPAEFPMLASALFQAMQHGGRFGLARIPWFNGGLFDDATCLPLEKADLDTLHSAATLDWSAIEPAIFGTLFERGLDPDKRSQLGAHYTDAGSIRRLIEPVIRDPLLAEWATVKGEMAADLNKGTPKARQQAINRLNGFLERLRTFRVLDPACGSGNFLYLALRTLKDIEHQVMLEAEVLGLQRGFPAVGPEAVLGIELNPYAAELARLTVWIGEIQWMLGHGYNLNDQPILKPLNTIEGRDALLTPDGTEATWPPADAIVGNPPFLGGSKLLRELGDQYVAILRRIYDGRVPGGADLVCYWFEKTRAQIEAGQAQRAGLVATNSIRGGASRKVLERIRESSTIFHAWADEPWINEGAAVRVSLVGFGEKVDGVMLGGQSVAEIYADLTGRLSDAGDGDLTQAKPLVENGGLAFQGPEKNGAFDILGDLARQWLTLPNPHGRPNSDVLRPRWNGLDLTRRPSDHWIIDFGAGMTEVEAALYEKPFGHVLLHVKPERDRNRDANRKKHWWRFGRTGEDVRTALAGLARYIATPHVAKHRVFVWLPASVLPDKMLIVVARSDDTTFGILHSRFHELWALRLGTSLEDRPRYTPTTCFETFPFPTGLTPNLPASAYADDPRARAIADTARKLNELRENWLNPPPWVDRIPEVVPGYPDRIIPKPEHAAELKKRTLTHLYNQRPAWLANAHRALDATVAAAYGWPVDLNDEEVLRRLLALNQERAGG